jgi:MerR family copper efflux transcriptional regulator/MerR family gold-responsive transcriptional activator of gol and ges genes
MRFIGELSARVGLRPSAIRFYESVGLVSADGRSDTRYRLYGPRAEHRLRFITRAKSFGMKLSEIRYLIDAPRGGRDSEANTLRGFIKTKTAELELQIRQLEAASVELEGLGAALDSQPPPDCCHLGDCACWLPDAHIPRESRG